MRRKAIKTDVPGIYRVWYRRWWWPFWRFAGFETAEHQPLTKDEVLRATKKHYQKPKNLEAARTVRGFAEIRPKKMDLRGNPGQTYRPPPRPYEPPRKDDDGPVGNDFLTGVIVGSMLSDRHDNVSSVAHSRSDADTEVSGGGGSFGGGGASGSWDSDSSSSSSSSDYSSSSSNSGGSSGGGE